MPETDPAQHDKAILSETAAWFQLAVPEPGPQNFTTQLGVHFEEVREMIHEINPLSPHTADLLLTADYALHALAKHFKENDGIAALKNRVEYVDSLADQIVTAVGCGHMAKVDVVGALDAVNESNSSKFEDGKPIFDANHKVAKGKNYKKADLTPFA